MPASRTTLNSRNLEALGAAQLAALLLELSQGHAAFKRRLRLALAAGSSAAEAGQELRKRFRSIAQARTYLDSAKRKTLLGELEGHLATISGNLAADNPTLAHELHWQLLELAEGIFDRCHDGSGSLASFFAKVLHQLGATVAAAQPSTGQLADRIADGLAENNSYNQLDGLVVALKEPLGADGLKALREALAARGLPERSAVMLALADALGDVDSFMACFEAHELQWPPTAAAVAERLLGAGRAAEALAVLQAVDLTGREWMAGLLSDGHIQALEALGHTEQAQQLRWQCFTAELNPRHLRAYLARLPAFEDGEAEERALDLVQADADGPGALRFLLAWPELRRAAALVLAEPNRWDGDDFGLYGPAAEQLEASQPLAATVLLRAMVVFALEAARTKRYRYAAEHLMRCDALAAAISNWQQLPDHDQFCAWLRQRYGRRSSFWHQLGS
jgi:hypothetical protein